MSSNQSKPFLRVFYVVLAALGVTVGTYISSDTDTHTHVDYKDKSAIHVVLVSGHGSILNSVYQTPGKQSPTWADSLKIYEGYSTKILAYDLASKLLTAGIDVTIINNFNTDMSLYERVNRINELWKVDQRLLLISLHHDAQNARNGDYIDFEGLRGFTSVTTGGATGLTVFTSPGLTESDNFADNYLLPVLQRCLPEITFRNRGKSKEAGFYVLTHTQCRAVLIEFNFMTTYTDCVQIADENCRDDYTTAICTACVQYNTIKTFRSYSNKKQLTLSWLSGAS